MDNNETFSSLNHAYNLWNFDLSGSLGLTDEAVSPSAAAHPFVYTHQGNFPRLYSVLLYALGARSAESQILLTALTIGTATVLMAQAFFRRLGGELFATTAVLLLIADYLLFAQWQVNTYRVWHGFFLFGSLNCVHGLELWPRRRWAVATFLLYACLFYWELVFATFVAINAALYTAWVYRLRPKLAIEAWIVQGSGAALALLTLISQLVAYLGWQDFLTDLRLTFTARNRFSSDPQLPHELTEFYSSHDIVFFQNFQSVTSYAGPLAFLRSLFRNVLQVPGPFLSLVGVTLAAAAYAARSHGPTPRDATVVLPRVALAATACIVPGMLALLLPLAAGGDAVFGARWPGIDVDVGGAMALALACLGLSTLLAFCVRLLACRLSLSGAPPGIGRCAGAGAFLLAVALVVVVQGELYDPATSALWRRFFAPVPTGVAKLLILTAALIGALLILVGRREMLGAWRHVPKSLAPFLVCGLLAYLSVYIASGGYLHTAYLIRLCPLPVFHVDALIALGAFITIVAARTLASQSMNEQGNDPRRSAKRALALVAAIVGVVFGASWISVQAKLVQKLPPDALAFIQNLTPAPGTNGVVTNNYGAPFGLAAATWSYGYATRPQDAAKYSYAWLRDRRSNPLYERPDFYVCFDSFSTLKVVVETFATNAAERGCTSMDIVRRGLYGSQGEALPRANIQARDEIADRWAIVWLDWKFHNQADR
jgi:hypothetical protein